MFKIGNKIRCINRGGSSLKLNKIYTVTFVYTDPQFIIVDGDNGGAYHHGRFEKITREEKLKRIIDEPKK